MFYDKWKVKIFLRSHCYDKSLEHEWIALVGLTLVKMMWKRLYEDITCFSLQISMVFRSYSLYAIWLTYILQKCKCSQTLLLSWTLWGLWEHLQHLRSWGKKSKRKSCWDFKMTLTYPWYLRYWCTRNWNSSDSVYFCFPCPNQCKHQFSLSVHVPHFMNLYRGLQ